MVHRNSLDLGIALEGVSRGGLPARQRLLRYQCRWMISFSGECSLRTAATPALLASGGRGLLFALALRRMLPMTSTRLRSRMREFGYCSTVAPARPHPRRRDRVPG